MSLTLLAGSKLILVSLIRRDGTKDIFQNHSCISDTKKVIICGGNKTISGQVVIVGVTNWLSLQ
jgi:hypothetical protein